MMAIAALYQMWTKILTNTSYNQLWGSRGTVNGDDFGQLFNISVLSLYKEFHNEVIMSIS